MRSTVARGGGTFTPMSNPWRRLANRPHLTLRWAIMPGILGLTDGRTMIVLHPHQTQVQRRCTLAHELAHVDLGHTDGCRPRDEQAARALAARRLIDLDELLAAWKWATSEAELADELWVDVDTLRARIEHLTDDEKGRVAAMILDRDDPA